MHTLNKRLFAILFLIFIAFGNCEVFGQKNGKFEIFGNLKWLRDGEKLVLQLLTGSHGNYQKIMFDSTTAKNGKFYLSGNVPEGPRLFFLRFPGHQTFTHLFVGNEKITIEDTNFNEPPKGGYLTDYLKISGSHSVDAFRYSLPLQHIFAFYNQGIQSYIRAIEDSLGYDKKLIESILNAKDIFMNAYLFELNNNVKNQKGGSFVIPQILSDQYVRIGKNPLLSELYNSLDEQTKNSYYGKILKEFLSTSIGQPAPDFPCILGNGHLSTLKQIASNSKLTLIYFWSLEARHSRADMLLELSNLYRKYHDKGFNIVNVFVGSDSLAWKRTIENDQLPWYQASDFKGPSDGIVKKYGFTFEIEPFTILVDGQGKIYNWITQGAVLKYYLERTFGQ